MYQDNVSQQDQKLSKFALLFELAIEHGTVELPHMTEKQALSFRSQMNRFRKARRASNAAYNTAWDLVRNSVVVIGDKWTIRMTYDKDFWDNINAKLGIPGNTEPAVIPVPAPDKPESLNDLLTKMYGDGAGQ